MDRPRDEAGAGSLGLRAQGGVLTAGTEPSVLLAKPLQKSWKRAVLWPAHGHHQPFSRPATSSGAALSSGQAVAAFSPSLCVDSSSCKISVWVALETEVEFRLVDLVGVCTDGGSPAPQE